MNPDQLVKAVSRRQEPRKKCKKGVGLGAPRGQKRLGLGLEKVLMTVWLNGVVVSALGIRALQPGFDSRFVPLFHWVPTFGKLFTHTASPVCQLQETGVQKGVFGA